MAAVDKNSVLSAGYKQPRMSGTGWKSWQAAGIAPKTKAAESGVMTDNHAL